MLARRGRERRTAVCTQASTPASPAGLIGGRDDGCDLAIGASLFQDARPRILPGSGSPLHLAQDRGGTVVDRSDGERPRRLFRHDRAPEGGVPRGAAGPDFLRHGGGFVLRRTGRSRRRPPLAQRLRGQQLDGRENAERGLRRNDVHASSTGRSGRRHPGLAQSRHDAAGRRAWRARRSQPCPRRTPPPRPSGPRRSETRHHPRAAEPVGARLAHQHAPRNRVARNQRHGARRPDRAAPRRDRHQGRAAP